MCPSVLQQDRLDLAKIYLQWDRLENGQDIKSKDLKDLANGIQLLQVANSYGITEGSLKKVWEYLCSEQELR